MLDEGREMAYPGYQANMVEGKYTWHFQTPVTPAIESSY